MIFSLAYSDIGTLAVDRLEQVAAVNNYTLTASGIVPGLRELSTEFRYKNPSAFSPWAALTQSNLQAISLDANYATYFEFRFTRTGSDTSGVIDVLRVDLHYDINPSATVGPGWFTTSTLYDDVVQFITGYIGSCLVQYSGNDAFTVEFSKPNKCKPDARPKVYFHRIEITDRRTDSVGCNYIQRVTFRIGIKGVCSRDEQIMRQQISYLIQLFNPATFNEYTFDIDFKGDSRLAILPYDLGVTSPTAGNMIELEDSECNCIMNEFQAGFNLVFPINNKIK